MLFKYIVIIYLFTCFSWRHFITLSPKLIIKPHDPVGLVLLLISFPRKMAPLRKMAFEALAWETGSLWQLICNLLIFLLKPLHLGLYVLIWDIISEIKVRNLIQNFINLFLEAAFGWGHGLVFWVVLRLRIVVIYASVVSVFSDPLFFEKLLFRLFPIDCLHFNFWGFRRPFLLFRRQILDGLWYSTGIGCVNTQQLVHQLPVAVFVRSSWKLAYTLWNGPVAASPEMFSTVFKRQLLPGNVIQHFRVELARQNPQQPIQLLVAILQYLDIERTPPVPEPQNKGKWDRGSKQDDETQGRLQ